MNITQVTVTIHEKRAHPIEHGHYDASVTLTATIEERGDWTVVIDTLQRNARQRVFRECDRWEEKIREQERTTDLENQLRTAFHTLSQTTVAYLRDECRRALRIIHEMPKEKQSFWLAQFKTRHEERKAEIEAEERKGEDQIPF